MVKLNRPHIGIFGRMNAGKSSLVNILSGQDTALVSAVAGTTTDPVKKIMEILGVGPVTLVDTAGLDDASELGAQRAGLDDASELGAQRVAKTKEILDQVNLAIIVFAESFGGYEKELAALCRARGVPFFFVHNKSDLYPAAPSRLEKTEVIEFSCRGGDAKVLLDAVRKHLPQSAYAQDDIFGGFVQENDEVRLILPQVQAMRCVLDLHAVGIGLQPQQLEGWLKTHTPKLVVTDSQAFGFVSSVVPASVPLTSFSILFSRLKGDFDLFLNSTPKIDALQEGDKVLILESCSHSVNICDDIGRVKLPSWLQKKTGKKLHMVTRAQILNRVHRLARAGVPVSNYGMAIAWCNGIFDRVTEIFRR